MDHRLKETSAVVNWVDGRIEGMHLSIAKKGPALVQLANMAVHIFVYRVAKFFKAPKFWQKQESHYLDA